MTKAEFLEIKPIIHLGDVALQANDFDRFFEIISTKADKNQIADIFMFFLTELKINPLEKMTAIPKGLFSKLPIESLYIPSNIRVIEPGAFKGNRYLEKVEFAATSPIEDIPELCFADCWNLEEVYLGRLTTYIDRAAFEDCNKVKIYVSCKKEDFIGVCEGDEDFYAGKLKSAPI